MISSAGDAFGDFYTLYASVVIAGSPDAGYVEETSGGASSYFPLPGEYTFPGRFLAVSPGGDVFVMCVSTNANVLYWLNGGEMPIPEPPVLSMMAPGGLDGPANAVQGLSVDANDDISIRLREPGIGGGQVVTYLLAATGPVPYFPSAVTGQVTGAGLTLSIPAAVSSLPVGYQWYFNGTAVGGATATTYDGPALGEGTYSITAATSAGTVTSGGAFDLPLVAPTPAPPTPPTFTLQPQASSFAYGSMAQLTAAASSAVPVSYQWQLNGVDIPGANQSTCSAAVPGSYTVVASNTAGSSTSSPAIVSLASRPVNLSARGEVGPRAPVITGFVVASYTGANKQLLLRAVGPTLSEFGVAGALSHPQLKVYDAAGEVVAQNAGWGNSAVVASASAATGAFALQSGSSDAAVVAELPPGTFTVEVTGGAGATGIVLVEVYEMAPDAGHLINLSTRAVIGAGTDVLIGGFVVAGTRASPLLIRGTGPGLTRFGVAGVLKTPVLTVFDAAGDQIAENASWADSAAVASAAAATGAFAFASDSGDCALVLTLNPGHYTVQLAGSGGATGAGLVEIYQVP